MKKTIKFLLAIMLVISLSFSGLFTNVSAQEVENVNVTLNKRYYAEMPGDKQNTGEVMDDFDGEALEGAGFTAFDVTDLYHERLAVKGATQEGVIASIQVEYNKTIPENAKQVGTEMITDVSGKAVFNNLPVKNGDNHAVYVFVETKTPTTPNVTQRSVPMVIAMPIYKITIEDNGSVTYTDEINTDIQLYPKNAGIEDEKLFTNPEEFLVVDVDGKKYFNIKTGDSLNFSIHLHIPADIEKIDNYVLIDTPTEGLKYIKETLTVTGLFEDKDYIFTEEGDGFKIDFIVNEFDENGNVTKPGSKSLFDLAGEMLTITYKMALTAEVTPDSIYGNNASISVGSDVKDITTKVDEKDPENPEYPEIPEFITYGHKFVKRDAQTSNPLQGAEFKISNKDGLFGKFDINSKGEYVFVAWVATLDEATALVSDGDGEIRVIGLTEGNYKIQETKAPSDKYVKIEGDIDFIVGKGYASENFVGLEILNHVKGLLPSTGGNGIYGFVGVGTVMMAAAYIWFKRSNKQKLLV